MSNGLNTKLKYRNPKQILNLNNISVYTSRSTTTTKTNKTGTWRFLRPEYREKTAPCSTACPAGTDIARVESLAAHGKEIEALGTILMENPFPAICGRVCFHPCESGCNRGAYDQPVAIQRIERYLGDTALDLTGGAVPEIQPANGRRAAIIGAGPAGLSAAYFLRILGFSCDVYEAKNEPGGIMRWGIPAYRLPKRVVAAEVDRITRLGVKIHCGTAVDPAGCQDLFEEFDALFLGCGLGRSIRLNIPGGHLVRDGLDYLHTVRTSNHSDIDGTAVVIGGGNTAVDLSRTLIRKGAVGVTLFYRRRIEDMPAFGDEVKRAVQEGVRVVTLASPARIESGDRGKILTLQSMKPVGMTGGGRARVVPDGGRLTQIQTDHVFMAVGAEADPIWQESNRSVKLSHCRLSTGDRPVITGGDLTNTTRSVPDAVASGKQAAMALDIFFKEGAANLEQCLEKNRIGNGTALSMEIYRKGPRRFNSPEVVAFDGINTDYFPESERTPESVVPPGESTRSFSEIHQTLTATDAGREARRCFNCGICTGCDNCRWFCPEIAVTVEGKNRHIETDWCKGCGICVTECPGNAMTLVEEPP